MPVTAGKNAAEISQRAQYGKGGFGRRYWDFRDAATLRHVIGPRVLDAGCGEGITLGKLASMFPDAQGIDIDPANVAICSQHDLSASLGDLAHLPFPDASFDSVVFMEVIEHIDDPVPVLAELARVTRPGGRLIVVYPVDWAMWLARIICLRWKEARFDPGHVRQWTARDLRAALRPAGYVVRCVQGLPLPWPLSLHVLVIAEKDL